MKTSLALVFLLALLIAWIAGARSLSLLLDRLHRVAMESQPITQLGLEDVSGGMLRINDLPMSTAAPDFHPYPMTATLDAAGRFVATSAGHAIALGQPEDSGRRSSTIKPASGEKAYFAVERSILSWPTPLEINFISGHSPSWKRHLYYHLKWEKPDGGRLEMIWRYEQYFYDDWASGFMTHEGSTGLIRVDIHPRILQP